MSIATEDWLKSSDSKEYFELVRFPTVGADPTHLRDCAQAATWLKAWLAKIGAEAEIILPEGAMSPASGELAVPTIFAQSKGDEGASTVLLYGHYDVQPPEPLDQWLSPPFEPTIRDGRVYARGAQDDKGQTFAFLCGLRELLAKPGPRPNVKIILDGQEESGSGILFRLLEDVAFRRRLQADVLLVCDTSAAPSLRPAIVAGLRGVNHFTVTLKAANRDLHSGEYGGIAPNAAQGLVALLTTLHNPDGSIAVSGFRDGIQPPSPDELRVAEEGLRASAEAFADARDPVEAMFRADIGTDPVGGQLGKSIVQRNAFEPTIEINGIHSGYGGPGSKTIIPCSAIAKISTRLVPGQSPRQCYEAIRRHLKDRCPKGMTLEFSEFTGDAAGFRLPITSPLFRLAESILAEMDSRGSVFMWDGASIPIVSALRQASGAAPLLVGWGQSEDRIHSPNESFSIEQFEKAKDWAKRILSAL